MKRDLIIIGVVFVLVAGGAFAFKFLKKNEPNLEEATVSKSGDIVTSTTTPSSNEIALQKGGNSDEPLEPKSGGVPELKWELMYTLNYETGEVPSTLKKYDGKRVKIAGFIVPLSDNISKLENFLLVPNPQACVHVPPPPPNLIVNVELKRAVPMDKVSNPSWIEGTLSIQTTEHAYGKASYYMVADKVTEYKF
ncbi:MAG: DUF3299 domain-containing protein [Bdellovibrionales bacterium]|nr:DUF3299 domain-containing protein [Bdellovibrionales bacterium]